MDIADKLDLLERQLSFIKACTFGDTCTFAGKLLSPQDLPGTFRAAEWVRSRLPMEGLDPGDLPWLPTWEIVHPGTTQRFDGGWVPELDELLEERFRNYEKSSPIYMRSPPMSRELYGVHLGSRVAPFEGVIESFVRILPAPKDVVEDPTLQDQFRQRLTPALWYELQKSARGEYWAWSTLSIAAVLPKDSFVKIPAIILAYLGGHMSQKKYDSGGWGGPLRVEECFHYKKRLIARLRSQKGQALQVDTRLLQWCPDDLDMEAWANEFEGRPRHSEIYTPADVGSVQTQGELF